MPLLHVFRIGGWAFIQTLKLFTTYVPDSWLVTRSLFLSYFVIAQLDLWLSQEATELQFGYARDSCQSTRLSWVKPLAHTQNHASVCLSLGYMGAPTYNNMHFLLEVLFRKISRLFLSDWTWSWGGFKWQRVHPHTDAYSGSSQPSHSIFDEHWGEEMNPPPSQI